MQYDFINELGYLALASRLKRISDAMIHSGRQLYKELGMDIEPNWYLIFKLLQKYKQLSVTEIASKLHFSHPSIVGLLTKMEGNGYVQHALDPQDSRKRHYTLTAKALRKLPELERVWQAGTQGVSALFAADSDFLQQLEKIEIQLSQADFRKRTLHELSSHATHFPRS